MTADKQNRPAKKAPSVRSNISYYSDTDYKHDGSTRNYWVAETLREILAEPQPNANTPPETFSRVIRTLMDQGNAVNEGAERERVPWRS